MNETGKKDLSEPRVTEKTITYLKGVRAEWDKVTWPEKRQVAVETVIVLAVVLFFTVLVYFLDLVFGFVFRLIPGG